MKSRVLGASCMALLCVLIAACEICEENSTPKGPSFSVQFDSGLTEQAQDGRLLLLLATHDEEEPRFLVDNSADTQLVFGLNVENWQSGDAIVFDSGAKSFPLASLAEVPSGTYYVQALLNRYKAVSLSNGKVVSLPPDRGEGQQWNRKPGNFYSTPIQIEISDSQTEAFALNLDQIIPDIVPPEDTKYIKHIRMRSELLSKFWGEDIYLGAHVL